MVADSLTTTKEKIFIENRDRIDERMERYKEEIVR